MMEIKSSELWVLQYSFEQGHFHVCTLSEMLRTNIAKFERGKDGLHADYFTLYVGPKSECEKAHRHFIEQVYHNQDKYHIPESYYVL